MRENALPNTSASVAEGVRAGLSASQRKQHRVLVIDDSPEICLVIEETLNLSGFHALVAQSGESGIAIAREQLPDLIICDVRMPGMDGCETLKALRADAATAHRR
jgi:twitching motility two-component system response regulator PilH